MMRLLKTGEIDYDAKLDKLVWTESQNEVDLDEKDDGQSDGSDWWEISWNSKRERGSFDQSISIEVINKFWHSKTILFPTPII